jgi:type I restriction enzyme S subunit
MKFKKKPLIMKFVKLEEICDVIAGQSPPSSTYNTIRKGLPFFQGKTDFGNLFPRVRIWCDSPIKTAEEGDILISVRAPVGPTNICNKKSCIGRGLSTIRPNNGILNKYILYYLRTIEKKISASANGSTFTAITQKEIKNIKIPICSLEDQIIIVKILDQAHDLRQKRKQAIGLLDEYVKSVFLEMFGDPVKNMNGLVKTRLKDICLKITDGTHDTPKRLSTGVKFITGKHIRPFKIDYENSDYVSELDHKEIYRRCNPEKGDILYTNIGVNVGTAAINIVEYPFSMKNVALLKLYNEKINSYYLASLLNNELMKKEILRKTCLGGAQQFLGLQDIKNIEIPIAQIDLQNKFAYIFQKTELTKQKMLKQKDELENQFQVLMQKAFRGEL